MAYGGQESVTKSLRCGDAAVEAILDELDASESTGRNERRDHQRFPYRKRLNLRLIEQPAFSAEFVRQVWARNLSTGGVSFLYGGYLHSQTKCIVQLVTLQGSWFETTGAVLECRLVRGNVHEAVVCFDQPVDPSFYCAEALRCNVLLAEGDSMTARLVSYHLERMNAEVAVFADIASATEMASQGSYDLVIVDVDLPAMDGFELIANLRNKGYSGAVAAFTGQTELDYRTRCRDAGFDRFLAKPFVADALRHLLESIREEPIYSEFHDDETMAPLINEFVQNLPQKIRDIEDALVTDDRNRLLDAVGILNQVGTGYGFEAITQAASALLEAPTPSGESTEHVRLAERLLKVCRLARGPC